MKCKFEVNGEMKSAEETQNEPAKGLGGMLQSILSQAKSIIYDTDKGYTLNGKNLDRVSDTQEGVIAKFRVNPTTRNMTLPEKMASEIWGAVKDNEGDWSFPRLAQDKKVETDEGYVAFDDFIRNKQERFDKSAVLGDVLHKYLESKYSSIPAHRVQAAKEYASLKQDPLLSPIHYEWIEQNYVNIAKKIGLNIFDDVDAKDTVLTETPIANELLGWGGRPDMIIERANGHLKLIDFKSSKSLNRAYSYEVMRYGRQKYDNITDNARERAKLQLALYAVMIKANNPDAKFEGLEIAWIPDERIARTFDSKAKVQVDLYIPMIRDYIKNEMPDVWAKLENKDTLFDPAEYSSSYEAATRESMKTSGHSPSVEYKNTLNRIAMLMQFSTSDNDFKYSGEDAVASRRQELKAQIRKLSDLQKGIDGIDAASWEDDVSFLSKWIGTPKDIANAWVRVYQQLYEENRLAAQAEHDKNMATFMSYLRPVWEQYLKRKGMKDISIANRTKYNDLYDFLYKDTNEGKRLRTSEKDFKAFEEEVREVSKEEKALARYLERTYSAQFAPDSYLMKKSIERKGRYDKISHMDIHNTPGPNKNSAKFVHSEGWFPKTPITIEEAGNYKFFSKEYWKEWYKRELTHYYETVFEQWNNNEEYIPIKYLGNPILDASERYTLNAEMQFDKFMMATTYKKHMDNVYLTGKAIKVYLELAQETENGAGWQNTIDYIGKSLDMHILGKREQEFKGGLTRQELATKGKSKQLSPVKLLRAVKKFGSAPIMWLRAASGTRNGIYTYLVTLKEALKYDVSTKLTGNIDAKDFGLTDLMKAHSAWTSMQKDSMQNKLDQNKTWLLMKRLRYLPDNYEWASDPNSLLSTRNKAWDQSTLYMFHSMPEQFVATMIMAAQLHAMKVDFNGVKTSLWDMYDVVPREEEGRTVYDLQWKIDPKTNKPFVRGTENFSNDPDVKDYRQLTELTSKESSKLKYVYQRIHGGYRHEERVMLEYHVLGEMFIQFKKYLPSILKNGLMSRSGRTLGYYKPKTGPDGKPLEDQDGNQIMQWHERVIEGRWLLFSKMLLAGLGAKFKYENPQTTFQIWADKNFGNLDNYRWSQLTEEDKLAFHDFIITMSTLFAMYLGYLFLFADADDDDQYRKYVERIMTDFSQQYNVVEVGRLLADVRPPSFKVATRFADAVSTMAVAGMYYSFGDEEGALTQRGRLRGWTEFQNTVPFFSAYRDVVRIIENNEDPDDIITTLYRYNK